MKKIKRIFIILTLIITLFTSSYSRVDAAAIPIGIGLKAILTYGLVAIGGLVAVDYTLKEDLDKAQAQQFYDEYTDVMDKELEEYAEKTGRSDIYYNFKDNNYWRKNQPFIPDFTWTDELKKLFKDFAEDFRSKFQEFPTEYAFFSQYGTIAQALDHNKTIGVRGVYSNFLGNNQGALFVFKVDKLEDDSSYNFIFVNDSNIIIERLNDDEIRIKPSTTGVKSILTGVVPNIQSYRYYVTDLSDDAIPIAVYKYDNTTINSVIDLPDGSVDDLKKEGKLIGGNKDILVEDAEWVKDVKKKGKSIYDVDVTHLDGDMDSDGNYIKKNTIPVIPDHVWVDAIDKKIPWDKLIQYPDAIIHDNDDVIVNTPEYPDNSKPDVYVPQNIDPGDNPELVRTDLKMVFPFCIPFDLIDAIKLFNAPPKAPVFEIPVPMGDLAQETVTVDLSSFEPVAQIFRNCMTILFIIFLIMATRHLIKG